jgi:hypothetical protein
MKKKPFWKLTAGDLAKATAEFNEPFVVDRSRSLTAAERQQWNRIKPKRGRPQIGRGFKRISVSLELGLLERATALARKRRMSRSQLFANLLTSALNEGNS